MSVPEKPAITPAEEINFLAQQMGRRKFMSAVGVLAATGAITPRLSSFLTASASGATTSNKIGARGLSSANATSGTIASATYLDIDVPAGFDWDGPDGAVPQTQFGMDNVFGRLVGYKLVNNGKGILVPDYNQLIGQLAESWTQNGLVWTFKLRQGVMSPAGNEFTADDVVYQCARAKSASGAAPIGWFLLNVGSVLGPMAKGATTVAGTDLGTAVTKIDKYTVQFTQLSSNRLFPGVLSIFGLSMADSTEMQKNATATDPWSHDWLNTKGAYTAGYGPYKLKSWQQGSQATYEANPGWNVPGLVQPAIQQFIQTKVPSTSVRVGTMEAGGAQFARNLTQKDWQALSADKAVKVLGQYGNQNNFIFCNNAVAPFNNKLVRQAFAYAIPYDAIVKSIYLGQAKRWYGCVPSSYPGFHEVKIYNTNYAKAKKLLAKAGFPNGKGLEKYRKAMALYYTAERADELEGLAVLVQTSLRKIGVNVTLNPIPQAEYGARQLVQKNLPFAIDDQEKPIAPDAGYAIQLFFVTTARGGLNNMQNYSNATVDDLWLNRARSATSTKKRNALLARAQELIMEDVAWIPLVERKTLLALAPDITDYELDPDNSMRMAYFRKV